MDVFISYSSLESEEAIAVNGILQKNGISTWMAPDSIPPGSNYTFEIPRAIKACTVFLLILSDKAQKSRWVSAEVENAFKNEKLILPLQIEKCQMRDEFDFLLSRSQRIEAYEKNADAMNNLVTTIKAILGSKKPTVSGETDFEAQLKKATVRPTTEMPKTSVYAGTEQKAVFADRFKSAEIEEKVRRANENSRILKEKIKLIEAKEELIKQKIIQFDTVSAEFDKKLQDFKFRASLISEKPNQTKQFENGDVWEGRYVNGKMSGVCTYKWASGGEYYGDFLEGKRTGFGIHNWKSGSVYEGEFLSGTLNGTGRYTWADGGVFIGKYVNEHSSGVGKHVWASGTSYIGDFLKGNRTGLGVETRTDGLEYKGDFVDGERNGLGRQTDENKVYTGTFDDGKKTGLGIFEWKNGDSLEGEYEENLLNGIGIYKWKSGTVYIGDYQKGQRTGFGRVIWPSGNHYDGRFENGKRVGKGTYFSDKAIIDGVWADDKVSDATEYDINGKVIAEYRNGTKYPK